MLGNKASDAAAEYEIYQQLVQKLITSSSSSSTIASDQQVLAGIIKGKENPLSYIFLAMHVKYDSV
jgi:hypothetical protein